MKNPFRSTHKRSMPLFIGVAASVFFIAVSVQAATFLEDVQVNGSLTVTGTNPFTIASSSPLTGDSIVVYPGKEAYAASPDPIQSQLRFSPIITASQSHTPVEADYNAGSYIDMTLDLAANEGATSFNRYFSELIRGRTLSSNTKTFGDLNTLGIITNFNGSGTAANIAGIADWTIIEGPVSGQVDGIWNGVWLGHDFNAPGHRITTYTADSGSYGSANIGIMIGFRSHQRAFDTSTINNLYAFYIDPPIHEVGASIVNNTGIYFSDQNTGSGTNYTIDARASTAQSAFGGPVHFNDTIDATKIGIGTANPAAPLGINKAQNGGTYSYVLNNSQGPEALAGVLVGNLAVGGHYGFLAQTGMKYVATQNFDTSSTTLLSASDMGGLNIATQYRKIGFWTGTGLRTTERMVILANGNIGIGTTTPSQKLDVNGTIHIEGSANGILMHDTATANCYLVQVTNGALALTSHECK